jgi:hypothetical protein
VHHGQTSGTQAVLRQGIDSCSVGTDIHSGTSVVIRDSAGKTVALGSLQAGVYAPLGSGSTVALNCTFPFSLTDVPAGDRFYSIEVANREQVNETEKNITAPIHLNTQGNSAS